MNADHKEVRAAIRSMSPRHAMEYIHSFQLPKEEELYLMECDVYDMTYTQMADRHHTTPETIRRRRHRAYRKTMDELRYRKSESRD